MISYMISKRKAGGFLISAAFMLLSVVFAVWGMQEDADPVCFPLAATLLLIANAAICMDAYEKHILFLAFQGTFFLFLVGGPLLEAMAGTSYYHAFSPVIAQKTQFCYYLSAFTMWIYQLCHMKNIHYHFGRLPAVRRSGAAPEQDRLIQIRVISRAAAYVALAAFSLQSLEKIVFRQSYSLQAYYAHYVSHLPGIVNKMGDCYLIAFFLYLATMPGKREARLPVLCYLAASLLTILYGVRNVAVLNLVFLLIYAVYRNRTGEVWLSKKAMALGIAVIPFAIVILQALDYFRRNVGFSLSEIREIFSFDLIREFFVSQSVSTEILANAMTYEDILGGQPVPYTFGTLYTYIKQNMVVRMITGEAAYTANSVQAALHSGNLGSRLAYHMYPVTYLQGVGMGGSYVADLYVDWSYPGIFMGTLLLCSLLEKIMRCASEEHVYLTALLFVSVRWLVYLPRDSCFSWAMQTFSIMNLLFLLLVWGIVRLRLLENLMVKKNAKNRKYHSRSGHLCEGSK